MRRMRVVLGLAVLTMATTAQAHSHPDSHVVEVAGSSAAGTHVFYAVSDGVDYVLHGPTGDVQLACSEVFLEGELTSGTAVDPFAVIKAVARSNTPDGFDGSERDGCTGPFGVVLEIGQVGAWEIHALGAVTTANTDLVPVYVSGAGDTALEVHVYALSGGPSGTTCNFRVGGFLEGTFDETTQRLTINEQWSSTGNLSVTNVLGNCFGLVAAGSGISVDNTFALGDDDAANSSSGISSFHPLYLEP